MEVKATFLRLLVKNAGGYWNPKKKTWIRSYLAAHEPGLEKRILDESVDLSFIHLWNL